MYMYHKRPRKKSETAQVGEATLRHAHTENEQRPKVEKLGERLRETEMERSPEKNPGPEKLCCRKNEERALNL